MIFLLEEKRKTKKLNDILWFQIASFGLANWTKKVFPLVPRNIQYRQRLKGLPFQFFWHCETCFPNKNPQRVPLQFFDVLRQMDVEKCERVPFLATSSVVSVFRLCPFAIFEP